ncbi:MAG: porin [Gammaproteobacteria bacterium]
MTRIKSSTLCGSAMLWLMAALSAPAQAGNDAMMQLIEIMYKKGSISAEEYRSLKIAAAADEEKNEAAQAEVEEKVKDMPKIETRGKFKVSSADGDWSWQPIGRVMADYNLVNSDINKIGSEPFIRRARLGFEGSMFGNWIYKLEMDFAGNGTSMKDGFIGYKSGNSWVKFGQSHIPFGLATLSSSKYMSFIERPFLADGPLQPARQLGVAAFTRGGNDRWTLHAGVFGAEQGGQPSGGGIDDELNIAARGTFVPLMRDKNHLMAVGAGIWYRKLVDRTLRVRQRPGIFRTADRFVDANFGAAADDTLGLNVEAAAVYGSFGFKSEYSRMTVNSALAGVPDADLDGYYAETSYFLTGESPKYDTGKAQFGSVAPNSVVGKGGYGGWQVAVRYDKLDLNDAVGVLGAGSGGAQEALTAGVNWYVNKNMRFMANYIYTLDMNRPGSAFDGDEPHGLSFRGQVYW